MLAAVEAKNLKARQRLHTTVFSQCFSPCGKYLATCDNFGNISIFSLPAALSADATEDSWKPTFSFKAQDGALYTLTTTDRLLIAGGTCDIQAWVWSDVIGRLELSGHEDYIHSVVLRSSQAQCVSGSEDGTVKIWDIRTPGEAVHTLEPFKGNESPNGKWIGSVAVDKADDWMICGGGPSARMWHLRSLEATTVFKTECTTHHVMFHEDSVISAGGDSSVKHWSVNGEQRAAVACTPTTVYNVAVNNKADNTKVMSIAGNSHKIDICTNFGYKAFSMSVC